MAPFLKIIVLAISLAVSGVDFGPRSVIVFHERMAMAGKSIKEVLVEQTPILMSLPGVVGTAQGLCDKKPCIVIYVIQITSDLEKKIPPTLEGYPVRIEETGEIRALPKK
jgi:hypothetical protein